MAGDLPPGKWTPTLIGPWWPGDSSALRSGETHWGAQSASQESYSQDLSNKAKELGRNSGTTASDLISRFESGATFHLDLAEKYAEKKRAFGKGAGAIDTLRSGLKGIAQDYNAKIEAIENSQINPGVKLTKIASLIGEANGQAAFKSTSAVGTLLDAVQQILTAEGVSMSAQEFLNNQGLNTDPPKPPDPAKAAADGLGLDGGMGDKGVGGGSEPGGAEGLGDKGSGGTTGIPGGSGGLGGRGDGGAPGGGGPLGIGMPGSGAQLPGGGQLPGSPSLPSGGQMSPAAALGGLSPDSLSQSFTQGMTSGQPLAAGAHSLSAGTMNAVEAGSAPPQAAPPAQMAPPPMVAPTVAGGGGGGFESAAVDHGSAGDAPVASSGPAHAAPIGPAVVAGPVAPAPAAPVMGGGAPAAPAGPLPGYGADLLRPAAAVPPPVSAGPVGGAPAAPVSPASSPSAGGPLVSPVDRSGAGAAGAQAGAGSSAAGASAVAAAGAGAAAGAASDVAVEQKRLQRLVDAVARQEPRLAWAACVRDDGTTVLTTDLAGGWIPPHVRLPVGVDRLLDPGKRRQGANALELLGGYKTAIAYNPNTYVAEPDGDAPALTADIRLRKVAPIDEFGPTLMDAVKRRDSGRIVHIVATGLTQRTGVDRNEEEKFRAHLSELQRTALSEYPNGRGVPDWMVAAAVGALLDDHPDVAQYHLAWLLAATGVCA